RDGDAAHPLLVRREVHAGEAEDRRLDLGGTRARLHERLANGGVQRRGGRFDPDVFPVRRPGHPEPEDGALTVRDRRVGLGAPAVDSEHDRHVDAPDAEAYARSTMSITTRPSAPLGLGWRPWEIASRNSLTCAVYIGCVQCSSSSVGASAGQIRSEEHTSELQSLA